MKNRIFVIDGSSYLYRAFHAMPPLTTSSGIPTGAVKGVTNMLLNLKKDSEGSPIIVVFDAKGKNFRNEIYADYKANRPPMPTELIDQLKPVKEICKAIGFPLIEINGVEADDVIATISKVAKNNGYKTVISSLDKDLMQLVSDPDVKMMNTMTHQIFDEQKVEEKFGVKPDQIRDLLALVGDSSDNIPGIPKVGQKTAAKWLIKYGSIKKIIENQNEITGVVGENLRNFSTNLQRNIELVSLKQDVNIGIDFEDLLRLNPDEDRLNALFNELEFKAMLTKQNSKKEKVTEKKYDLVLSEKDLQKWIKKIKKANVFAIDTETSSLDILSSELIGISLSISEGEACYIPIGHVYEDCPKQLSLEYIKQHLRPCLEENQNKAVGQNLKFDLPVLNRHGFRIKKFHADTMIMSYILDSTATRHSLDRLAQFYLNKETIKYTDLTGTASKQIPFSQVDLKKAGEYAAEDADITLQLFYCFDEMLKDNNSLNNLLKNIEYPLISVLIEVETNGAKIDNEKLSNHSVELGKRIKMLSADAYELANKEFNLDSPKQLLEVLYTDLGLPVLTKTPKGQPSTNEETLVRLAEEYELPKIILEYRSLAKLKSTYTDSLVKLENPVSKRIHTSYHQAVTSTGRLSSTEPNLQNIPIKNEEGRKIREAFIPESGNILIAADYSQIELRIMAHLSKDKNLVKAFKNNLDVHSSTASEIFEVDIQNVTREQRRSAKAINFGLMYGMTAFGLTRQLGIPRSEAQKYFDAYFSKYTGVQEYMNKTRNSARERSFVETIMGRRLNLKEINSPNGLRRQAAERAAINAPLQGSAADIIKKAMIDIDAFITNKMPELKMIMQVHDELVFEAPENFSNEAIKEIKNIMENCVQLDIPLIVEASIGKNWNEAH